MTNILVENKTGLYCPPVYLVLLCCAIVEWDTVGIDIITHHLHTAKWGLFVLYIEQNNSNHKNKNRKVPLSLGLFEDLLQLQYFFKIP